MRESRTELRGLSGFPFTTAPLLRDPHMAAPYVHPRLAAVAHRHTNTDGSPVGLRVNVIMHGAAPETPRFAETVPGISDKRH
jgi:hypothetical protein